MKKIALIYFGIFFLAQLSAQSTFQVSYGAPAANWPFKTKQVGKLIELSDGYVFTCSALAPNKGELLIKTTLNGDTLWTRKYNNPQAHSVYSRALIPIGNNGFLIGYDVIWAASAEHKCELIRVDSTGQVMWTTDYNITNFETWLGDIVQNPDGSFEMVGYSLNSGLPGNYYGTILVHLSSTGQVISSKKLGTTSTWYEAFSIKITSDGGYIITGKSFYPDNKCMLVKLDANENILWNKVYDVNAAAGNVEEAPNGEFVINTGNGTIIKTNANGNPVWCKKEIIANLEVVQGMVITAIMELLFQAIVPIIIK
jgi:hypothetical protein